MRRQLKVLLQGAQIRTASFRGLEHLVVPVVALREGVIFASNAEHAELVLARELQASLSAWNGRPVVYGHPIVEGEPVSANTPEILQSYQIGSVFASRIDDSALKCEAWLDPVMIAAAKAEGLVSKLQAGETVEVSVGVLVTAEAKTGTFGGLEYSGVWTDVLPDHLAMLREGEIGACSVEMGCGAPRAAKQKAKGEGMLKLKEKIAALAARLAAAAEIEGESANELRDELWEMLYANVPAFIGVVDIFPDTSTVIYAVSEGPSPYDGPSCLYSVSYTAAADGTITLGTDVQKVEKQEKYVVVSEAEAEVETPAAGEAGEAEPTQMSAAASGCGCGGDRTLATKQEANMECRKTLIAKILGKKPARFVQEDVPALEHLSDARLKALADEEEQPAEPPKEEEPQPEEDPKILRERVLSLFPDLQTALSESQARSAARREAAILALKDQKVYSADELKGMDVAQLEKLVALTAKPGKAAAPRAVDFQAAGVVTGAARTDAVAAPPNLRERVLAARGKKAS
jgi:hypothetical protein